MRSLVIAPLVGASAMRAETEGGVVKKVVDLLRQMVETQTKEMNAEQVAWAAREQECKMSIEDLGQDIAEAKDLKASLEAKKAAAQGKAEEYKQLLIAETKTITTSVDTQVKIKKQRAEEHASYVVEQKDLSESVSALDRAVALIAHAQKETGKVPQSFLQTSTLIPENIRGLALSMLEVEESQNPEAAAYEGHSHGIMELLEEAQENFKTELHKIEMDETHRRQNYEIEYEALAQKIKNAQTASVAHDETISAEKAAAGEASERLTKVQADLSNMTSELGTTTSSCNTEQGAYTEKQEMRTQELNAVKQAISILTSRVTEKAALSQTSFLQIRDSGVNDQANAAKVSMFLSKRADKIKSKVLSLIAEKIAEDPFVKVRKMIEGMIDKLTKEAGEEAQLVTHCRKEMGKGKRKLQKHNKSYLKHKAAVEENSAKAAQAADLNKTQTSEIDKLSQELAAYTKQRAADAKAFDTALAEAEDEEKAIIEATQVLKSYYEKAASAATKAVIPADPSPGQWAPGGALFANAGKTGEKQPRPSVPPSEAGDKYAGQQDTSRVIIAMLETASSDCSVNIMKMKEAEDQAKADFLKFKQQTEVTVAGKKVIAEGAKADALDAKTKTTSAQEEMEAAERQVKAAEDEYAALLPGCPASEGGTLNVITHEQRQAQRQEEIDSLKEALTVLSA